MLAGPPAFAGLTPCDSSPRGAGDLARRAGNHAGAWALKRPGSPEGQQAVTGQPPAQAVGIERAPD
jgi:hypothetical protein